MSPTVVEPSGKAPSPHTFTGAEQPENAEESTMSGLQRSFMLSNSEEKKILSRSSNGRELAELPAKRLQRAGPEVDNSENEPTLVEPSSSESQSVFEQISSLDAEIASLQAKLSAVSAPLQFDVQMNSASPIALCESTLPHAPNQASTSDSTALPDIPIMQPSEKSPRMKSELNQPQSATSQLTSKNRITNLMHLSKNLPNGNGRAPASALSGTFHFTFGKLPPSAAPSLKQSSRQRENDRLPLDQIASTPREGLSGLSRNDQSEFNTANPPLYERLYEENRKRKYQSIEQNLPFPQNTPSSTPFNAFAHVPPPLTIQSTTAEHPGKVYRSVEDYPVYHSNFNSNAKTRPYIVNAVRRHHFLLAQKKVALRAAYKEHNDAYVNSLASATSKRGSDRSSVKRARINSGMDGNEEEEVSVRGTRRTNPLTRGDAVRSEAEFQELLLMFGQESDPPLSRYAVDPPMEIDPEELGRFRHFVDTNNLVENPVAELEAYNARVPMSWSDDEREIFRQKLAQFGKQFGKIASYIPGKTTAECVQYYYLEKVNLDFKQLLKRGFGGNSSAGGGGGRMRRGLTQAAKKVDQLVAVVTTVKEDERANRKSRRAAAAAVSADDGEYDDATPGVLVEEEERRSKGKSATVEDNDANRMSIAGFDEPLSALSMSGSRLPSSPGIPSGIGPPRMAQDLQAPKTPTLMPTTPIQAPTTATSGWTDEEETRFAEAVGLHFRDFKVGASRDFKLIAVVVGTRTEEECKRHWQRYRKRKINNEAKRASEEGEQGKKEDGGELIQGDDEKAKGRKKGAKTTKGRKVKKLEEDGMGIDLAGQGDLMQVALLAKGQAIGLNPTGEDPHMLVPADGQALGTLSPLQPQFTSSGQGQPSTNGAATSAGARKTGSYWTVSEKERFTKSLAIYGRDWDAIARSIGSKSSVQARNFFNSSRKKMRLDELLADHGHSVEDEPPPQIAKRTGSGPSSPMVGGRSSVSGPSGPIQPVPSMTDPSLIPMAQRAPAGQPDLRGPGLPPQASGLPQPQSLSNQQPIAMHPMASRDPHYPTPYPGNGAPSPHHPYTSRQYHPPGSSGPPSSGPYLASVIAGIEDQPRDFRDGFDEDGPKAGQHYPATSAGTQRVQLPPLRGESGEYPFGQQPGGSGRGYYQQGGVGSWQYGRSSQSGQYYGGPRERFPSGLPPPGSAPPSTGATGAPGYGSRPGPPGYAIAEGHVPPPYGRDGVPPFGRDGNMGMYRDGQQINPSAYGEGMPASSGYPRDSQGPPPLLSYPREGPQPSSHYAQDGPGIGVGYSRNGPGYGREGGAGPGVREPPLRANYGNEGPQGAGVVYGRDPLMKHHGREGQPPTYGRDARLVGAYGRDVMYGREGAGPGYARDPQQQGHHPHSFPRDSGTQPPPSSSSSAYAREIYARDVPTSAAYAREGPPGQTSGPPYHNYDSYGSKSNPGGGSNSGGSTPSTNFPDVRQRNIGSLLSAGSPDEYRTRKPVLLPPPPGVSPGGPGVPPTTSSGYPMHSHSGYGTPPSSYVGTAPPHHPLPPPTSTSTPVVVESSAQRSIPAEPESGHLLPFAATSQPLPPPSRVPTPSQPWLPAPAVTGGASANSSAPSSSNSTPVPLASIASRRDSVDSFYYPFAGGGGQGAGGGPPTPNPGGSQVKLPSLMTFLRGGEEIPRNPTPPQPSMPRGTQEGGGSQM
ncbi:hypothetical protein BJ742DRAFT_817209 [Cladochytrium replicatum]|nr:hypothetical protein BJ742DRAFT_817209 [Cladochytrium replicatum]